MPRYSIDYTGRFGSKRLLLSKYQDAYSESIDVSRTKYASPLYAKSKKLQSTRTIAFLIVNPTSFSQHAHVSMVCIHMMVGGHRFCRNADHEMPIQQTAFLSIRHFTIHPHPRPAADDHGQDEKHISISVQTLSAGGFRDNPLDPNQTQLDITTQRPCTTIPTAVSWCLHTVVPMFYQTVHCSANSCAMPIGKESL